MRRRVAKRIEGLVSSVTDVTLLSIFSVLYSARPGRRTMQDALFGPNGATELLEEVNYQVIKRALYKLTAKGFIKRTAQRTQEFEITAFGKRRIDTLIPEYHSRRPWDKHVYLISYDIPSTHNAARNLLRDHIRKTGGALLQDSLWIHPYNPSALLKEFTSVHSIPGTILVSKLGKDGTIGEEKLVDLLRRVYKLDDLADRYDEFLDRFSGKKIDSPALLCIAYSAVLTDDPQLPFPLLPHDFPAEEAYLLFSSHFSKMILS